MAAVRLVGSRAAGAPTPLSDWDFLVETDDFDAVSRDLPRLVEPLAPLAAQWDRLSEEAAYYMLVLPGAIKVDLVFDRTPVLPPPWEVTADTLDAVDAHFWDWALWLGGKELAGEHELMSSQLGGALHHHLLAPLGVGEAPSTLADAVTAYRSARDLRAAELGVAIDGALEAAVVERLRAAGVLEG